MTTYADTTERQRGGLPDHVAWWVTEVYPCRCHDDWTARGMHATDCQHAVAVDVLDTAHTDGLLKDHPEAPTIMLDGLELCRHFIPRETLDDGTPRCGLCHPTHDRSER